MGPGAASPELRGGDSPGAARADALSWEERGTVSALHGGGEAGPTPAGAVLGAVAGARASEAEAGAGSEHGRAGEAGAQGCAVSMHEAQAQLGQLDMALLALIPAAELQATDRTLSLDPVDVDKAAAEFMRTALLVQRTFTELRARAFAAEGTQEAHMEVQALEAELLTVDHLLAFIDTRVASWRKVLARWQRELRGVLEDV